MERKWFSKNSKSLGGTVTVSQRKNAGKSSAFEIYNKNAEKVKTILPEKQTMEMIIYRLIYVSIHLFIPII